MLHLNLFINFKHLIDSFGWPQSFSEYQPYYGADNYCYSFYRIKFRFYLVWFIPELVCSSLVSPFSTIQTYAFITEASCDLGLQMLCKFIYQQTLSNCSFLQVFCWYTQCYIDANLLLIYIPIGSIYSHNCGQIVSGLLKHFSQRTQGLSFSVHVQDSSIIIYFRLLVRPNEDASWDSRLTQKKANSFLVYAGFYSIGVLHKPDETQNIYYCEYFVRHVLVYSLGVTDSLQVNNGHVSCV